MSAAEVIKWSVFGLCVIFALIRVPDALRGRNRSVFLSLVLLALAVGLSLPPLYLAVDQLLGGVNIANLVIRLSLYAIFAILGVRTAIAFGSQRTRRIIAGPIGLAVLAITVLVTVALFVVSDLPESSTGLRAYGDQQAVQWYADMGRYYPGYVAACLLSPATGGLLDGAARPIHRICSGLMAFGFALVVVFAVASIWGPLGLFDVILPFGAIVFVTVGLTVAWISRRRSEAGSQRNLLA
ncbi:hypothetical protein [Arthrobacter sp. H5]|uniref:hypothetical protein n=1 Tax=Arthrobacter sp. H5 TaxID=1267973 RepID=UPI0004838248|nr:hypothetical protein [Arthrobacter sp. H5]